MRDFSPRVATLLLQGQKGKRKRLPGLFVVINEMTAWYGGRFKFKSEERARRAVPLQRTRQRLRAEDYSEAPKGRKYWVPLTGSWRRRRSCWRSSLRSTKSMSEVLMTRRSEAA